MHIRHLEHLLAVADTGSFSRAAERSHVTQSALSRSIRSLEDSLGGRLIDRIGKRNALTPLGQEVVARARDLVRGVEELQRSAERLERGQGGYIRVGLGSGPGGLLMTPLLCHVARQHPSLQVSISRGPAELQLVQLRARQLEALVVDSRRISPAPDLLIEHLVELRTGFICASDHPLVGIQRLTLSDLRRYPVATTPLSSEVARLLVEQYGPDADPASLASLQCEDVGSLIDTVSRTQAVFLGVVAAARDGLKAGRLHELKMNPRLKATARFAYVTLAGRTQPPVMSAFRQFVSDHLRD